MVPLVIGVVAGAGLLLLVAVALLFFTSTRKKKKSQSQMYVGAHSRGNNNGHHGADQYYAHSQRGHHQNWPQNGATDPNDHMVNILPPPPGVGSWPAPPPPPPPQLVLSSGEMSSSNFSGPVGPVLPPPPPSVALGFNKSTFTYEELMAATAGFSQANLLGQGGFGYVHKGVLPNGKEIAVKSLKSGSGQGDREFQAEVEIISRVHHRHLVSLVGYSIAGERKMLVYEFLPNNNLDVHLHAKERQPMDWASRLKIAIGSAKGLAYLHEDCHPRIIHRDIKTSNILLDFNFEAKVADFGLAKLNQDNYTHVSTRVMGTFGYMAPEYVLSGKLTDKSDVFSFGVVLLELITGRRPVNTTGDYMDDSLVDWATPLCLKALEDGSYDELADPRLEKNYVPHEMARMVACAAASIRHSGRRRPKMSQIVRALEGDVSLEDLNEGVKPGQSSYFGSSSENNHDVGSYSANMRKFRKIALDSQDYGSSEYGATSEYGLDPSSSSDDSSREISRKGSRINVA